VLVEEALGFWVTDLEGRYLDGTVGGGGHAEALLSRFPRAELIGLDRDPDALAEATRRLAPYGERVHLARADFADMEEILTGIGGSPVVGILLDVGVSSHQLDDPMRGFSYLAAGPLRMTLDRDASQGAGEFLAAVDEEELSTVLRELGELPAARRAARAVIAARNKGTLRSTEDLREALRQGGVMSPRRLSQAFQALRMAVNDELGSLRAGLDAAARTLPSGGTLTVISFESLMDRVVKQTFRPPRFDRPHPGLADPEPRWRLLARRAVRPGPEETARNPRSRSARLRAAARTSHA